MTMMTTSFRSDLTAQVSVKGGHFLAYQWLRHVKAVHDEAGQEEPTPEVRHLQAQAQFHLAWYHSSAVLDRCDVCGGTGGWVDGGEAVVCPRCQQ